MGFVNITNRPTEAIRPHIWIHTEVKGFAKDIYE